MATCQCAGETCQCEAIQVLPKLPFWKKHDRRVHGFVAWMAVLNTALVASLPLAMSAQEITPSDAAQTKPPVMAGVEQCMQHCAEESQRCQMTSTSEEATPMCEARVKECLSRCVLAPQLGLPPKGAETAKKLEMKSDLSAEALRKQAQANKQQLELAKKRISEFARNVATIKAKAAQIEKSGMRAPAGLKEAISEGEKLIAKVKAAKTLEQLGPAGETQTGMEAIAESLKQGLVPLEKQKGAPQKFLAFEKKLRQFEQQFATIKKMIGTDPAMTDLLSAVEQPLQEMKTTYRQAHDMIKAGNAEDGFLLLETRVPELASQYDQALKALSDARAGTTEE